jgi:hypothetical protein
MFDLGFGWSFLMGDIGNTSPAPSSALQFSYGLSIRQAIMPYLSVSIDFSTGKFYGEKALGDTENLNFQTSVISQGLQFTYEASHLFNRNNKGFVQYQPYVGIGVGLISFRAKGDLKDGNLNTYNYWSDGTIRSLPETPNNVDLAEVISRDLVYESDLRDANLDGFGRYDQMALRIPIELGFRYQFTKRIGAHIKGIYNLNFTDLLDNVTSESLGDRQANADNDNHLSAMMGVSVYLGEYRKPKKKKREPMPALLAEEDLDSNNQEVDPIQDSISNLAVVSVNNDNQDSDSKEESSNYSKNLDSEAITSSEYGAKNVEDVGQVDEAMLGNESASTKNEIDKSASNKSTGESNTDILSQIEITENQYSLSVDSNSQNESSESSKNATIDQSEVGEPSSAISDSSTSSTTNDNSIENTIAQPNSISKKEQRTNELTTFDLIEKTMGIGSTEPKIAGRFHWADVNTDKYISADEVLHFIDLLFDGESEYTLPMIHELIEYYFDQD